MNRPRHALARPAPEQRPAATRVRQLLPESGAQVAPWELPPERTGPPPPTGAPTARPSLEHPQPLPAERSWQPAPTGLEPPEQELPRPWEALRGGRWDLTPRGTAALAVVGLLAALLTAGVVARGRPQELSVPVVEQAGLPVAGVDAALGSPPPAPPQGELVVAVAGKVRRPGVVRLPPGSRVQDAVTAAGGLLDGTDAGLLNLARPVLDGEQVLVGVEPQPGVTSGGQGPQDARVPLNTADAADLDALPGIGPVLAERIVTFRTENGPFRDVDQLADVEGIGPALVDKLRDAVRV